MNFRASPAVLGAVAVMIWPALARGEENPRGDSSGRPPDFLWSPEPPPVPALEETGRDPLLPPADPEPQRFRRPGFFDWEHFEGSAFLGAVHFSGDFEADPSWSAGLLLRVPVPGLPLDHWGIFVEGIASHLDRDLPVIFDNHEDFFYAGVIGADFTFVQEREWFLAAQGGLLYVGYGDIENTEDGAGGLAGLVFGIVLVTSYQTVSLTYNPQFTWDTEDWMMFHHIGIRIDF